MKRIEKIKRRGISLVKRDRGFPRRSGQVKIPCPRFLFTYTGNDTNVRCGIPSANWADNISGSGWELRKYHAVVRGLMREKNTSILYCIHIGSASKLCADEQDDFC